VCQALDEALLERLANRHEHDRQVQCPYRPKGIL